METIKIDTAERKLSKNGKAYWSLSSNGERYTAWENGWRATTFKPGMTIQANVKVDGKFKTIMPPSERPQASREPIPTHSNSEELVRIMAQAVHELQIIRDVLMQIKDTKGSVVGELPPPHTDKDLALPEEVADDLF